MNPRCYKQIAMKRYRVGKRKLLRACLWTGGAIAQPKAGHEEKKRGEVYASKTASAKNAENIKDTL